MSAYGSAWISLRYLKNIFAFLNNFNLGIFFLPVWEVFELQK